MFSCVSTTLTERFSENAIPPSFLNVIETVAVTVNMWSVDVVLGGCSGSFTRNSLFVYCLAVTAARIIPVFGGAPIKKNSYLKCLYRW